MEIEVDELSVGMGLCPLGDNNKCIDYGFACPNFIEIANLKHCAGEVCKALEALFHWKYFKGKRNKNHLAEELADVITCALIAAAKEDVDIEPALLRVQKKNARRAE